MQICTHFLGFSALPTKSSQVHIQREGSAGLLYGLSVISSIICCPRSGNLYRMGNLHPTLPKSSARWHVCYGAGDGQVAVLNGLLRASGRQGKGAVINWASYWLLGLPVSYLLAFTCNWGLYGLRVGLMVAAACQALVLHVIASCRFDWDREVERAKELVGGGQEGATSYAADGIGATPMDGAAGAVDEEVAMNRGGMALGSASSTKVDDELQQPLLPNIKTQGQSGSRL